MSTQVDSNHEHVKHIKAYSPQAGSMVPGSFQKFLRTCVIYQFCRLLAINVKMIRVILKSH
ncbi:hypothetical protein MNB_SM-3-306 [hydrothermal vent metagenome]|uniref:Uncharacterized protein n=1 Tax=hydrothermal vent metagenome TaxID=652676 RepID=A0A1W1D5Y0_9ZZZZ